MMRLANLSQGQRLLSLKTFRCKGLPVFNRSYSAESSSQYNFETLSLSEPREYVFHVEINRPEKLNTMNTVFWKELHECFLALNQDTRCRSIVLSGRGKLFCAGIDLADFADMAAIVTSDEDIAKKSRTLKNLIVQYQNSLSSLEKCAKPVIAAVHSACVGGGVDLICSADIRYCSSDAWFQVKEVDLGLAADVGTLQRLPKLLGNQSLVRELCFTGRKLGADEAQKIGFVSRVLPDRETLLRVSIELAALIAEKSPVAVQATKETLIHARDHSVQEGLDFIANLNMNLLQSQDVLNAGMAAMKKEKATFSKY